MKPSWLPPPTDEERTYHCPHCLDSGYTSHPFKGCQVGWFCDCDSGRPMEAGYWFDKRYPAGPTGKRLPEDKGKAKLDAYMLANPEKRAWLPDALEGLRIRYEDARKRKLQGDEDYSS